MSEKGIALLTEKWADNLAGQVAACGNFSCRNMNLIAVAVGILNGCAVNDAIEARPENGGHAHGTWLARGVKRISVKRDLMQLARGKTHGADLSVRGGINLLRNTVKGAKEQAAGLRVDHGRAEGSRTRGALRARSERHKSKHLGAIAVAQLGLRQSSVRGIGCRSAHARS